MARVDSGINGGFDGKVGTVIGYTRNGKSFMRSVPVRKRKKSRNPKEIANRKKFADAQAFLKPLLPIVKEGFRSEKKGQEFIMAKSWLLKNSFEGEWNNQKITPAKVVLSMGNLHLPQNIAVGMTTPGKLDFTWDAVDKLANDAKDQVMIVAYDFEHEELKMEIAGEFRYKGIDSIDLPEGKGYNFHLYFAMLSADRSRRSQSVYLGSWNT